MQNITRSK